MFLKVDDLLGPLEGVGGFGGDWACAVYRGSWVKGSRSRGLCLWASPVRMLLKVAILLGLLEGLEGFWVGSFSLMLGRAVCFVASE